MGDETVNDGNGKSLQLHAAGVPVPMLTADVVEKALMVGDFSKMDAQTRVSYYLAVCQSAGLNPMTRPFIPMKTQSGEVVLYATRECAEQLRAKHRVSLRIVSREKFDGLYCVTVEGKLPDGRSEEAQGIVEIASLKGQALGNSLMRCESKAKRRVTLALCGLGFDLADDGYHAIDVGFNLRTGEIDNRDINQNGHGGNGDGNVEKEKTVEAHIADLTGREDGTSIEAQITAFILAQGGTDASVKAWWAVQRKKHADLSPGYLSYLYEKLQEEAQRRKDARGATEETGVTTSESDAADQSHDEVFDAEASASLDRELAEETF